MKRILTGICIFVFVLCVGASNLSFAQEEKGKGASPKAYEHANENSIFNRVGDWFATVGKSDKEKERIKAERKTQRALKRSEKKMKEALQEREQKGKQTQDQLQERTRQMQGKPAQESQRKMKGAGKR